MALDQGPDALADDEVVVGQEDVDRAVRGCRRGRSIDSSSRILSGPRHRWADLRQRGGARHTTRRLSPPCRTVPATARAWPHATRQSSVTSLSWIPSEAIEGRTRLAFDSGSPTTTIRRPTALGDLERAAGRGPVPLRQRARGPGSTSDEAGRITDCGYERRRPDGRHDGQRSAAAATVFQAVALPDIQREPERGDGWVRFVQTAGGRTGLPAPRRVRRRAVRPVAGTAGLDDAVAHPACRRTTRVRARPAPAGSRGTGSTTPTASCRTSPASPTSRTGTASRSASHSPWGDEDSEALVTAVESALERSLVGPADAGAAKPRIERVPAGAARQPGRARHRGLPGPRRGGPGRARRRAAGRVRTRGPARRAGPPRGRRRTSSSSR